MYNYIEKKKIWTRRNLDSLELMGTVGNWTKLLWCKDQITSLWMMLLLMMIKTAPPPIYRIIRKIGSMLRVEIITLQENDTIQNQSYQQSLNSKNHSRTGKISEFVERIVYACWGWETLSRLMKMLSLMQSLASYSDWKKNIKNTRDNYGWGYGSG